MSDGNIRVSRAGWRICRTCDRLRKYAEYHGLPRERVPGPSGGGPSFSVIQRIARRIERRGPDECWPWIGRHNHKGRAVLPKSRTDTQYAARILWQIIHGRLPKALCVCHHCDNPSCMNMRHLFVGTVLDNNRDMIRKGRSRTPVTAGTGHWKAKLSEPDVYAVRELVAAGTADADIAKRFGVSREAIRDIRRNVSWRSLQAIRLSGDSPVEDVPS